MNFSDFKNKFSNRHLTWLVLLIPVLIYSTFAYKSLDVPGLYMDAANPDYHSVWILRGPLQMPTPPYHDNVFSASDRFPLLNSLYGGNATAYFGLIFFSIFGFGLTQLRVLHGCFGAFALLSLGWCLLEWRVPKRWLFIMLAVLAVDPTFVFAWRTQYYLQLFPTIFFALGLGFLGRADHENSDSKRNWPLILAGLLFGFSAYCYFIFAFYLVAVVLVYILNQYRRSNLLKILAPLAIGALTGWLPFLFAHLSIVLNTGISGYLKSVKELQTSYGVVDLSQGGLAGRFATVVERVKYLGSGDPIQAAIFDFIGIGNGFEFIHYTLIWTAIVLALTALVILFRRSEEGATLSVKLKGADALLCCLLSILGIHVLVGIIIGRPLQLQHYIMLLPIIDLILLIAIVSLQRLFPVQFLSRLIFRYVLPLGLFCVFTVNCLASRNCITRLEQEGGERMYTDAINVAAKKIKAFSLDTVILYPQWGYWMGLSTILGPSYNFAMSNSLADMPADLAHIESQIGRHPLVMVIGHELLKNGEEFALHDVQEFAHKSGLIVDSVIDCPGRNGHDHVWLVKLSHN